MIRTDLIRFGLKDIRAVCCECNSCHTRLAFAPEKIETLPEQCPLGHSWTWNVNTGYK